MAIEGIGSDLASTYLMSAMLQASSTNAFSEILDNALSSGSTDLDALFAKAAKQYGISENLLKAVAKAESSFNPEVVSSAGAMGIMQLMPATANELGVTDAFDPEQSIMGGAKLLRRLLDRYDNDVELALAAYNAGAGNVDKYGGVPPFAETRAYVPKVLGYMGQDITAGTVKASSGASSDLLENLAGTSDPDELSSLMKEYMIMYMLMNNPTLNGSDDKRYTF